MSKYLFDVTHFDVQGQRTQLQRYVERDWASVPRGSEFVSLGGGGLVAAEVVSATYNDGWVELTFLVKQDEADVSVQQLRDLGFDDRPEPAGPAAVYRS